ncbi:MAG: polymer-forming cytoskeletal protein [Acidobacteriota bacterium]
MAIKISAQKGEEEPMYKNDNSATSYIGEGVKIKGNIVTEQPIVLKGKLKGNLQAKDSVTIEQGGEVNGNIKARTVNLFGKATGDIKTEDKLSIFPSGKFNGNINSLNIVIKEGGKFSGTANLDEKTSSDK